MLDDDNDREILDAEKQNNANFKREKRPDFRYESGATYRGEWVGKQRDG